MVKIADDSGVGTEENIVYGYRENGNTWGSNSNNAWAHFDDNPYILVNFTGTGIDYLVGAGNETKYQFELDGEVVGNIGSENGSVRYSVRDLEEKPHTLKVSLGDNTVQEDYMDYRGVNIYSTPNQSNNSIIFDFKGTGFNLFGATPDALLDVYIDDQLIDDDYRVYSKGDRQTTYSIRGLEDTDHTAKVVVKGGTFTFDGMDIIIGTNPDDDETPGDGDETPGDGDETPGDGDETPGDGDETPGDGDETPGDGDETPGDGDETPGDGDEMPGDGDETPGDGDETPGDGDEAPGDDHDLKLGIGQEAKLVEAGKTYSIDGTNAKVTMPSDLPAGTKLIVNEKDVNQTNHDGLTPSGDLLTFTFDLVDGSTVPSEGYTLTLSYDEGVDAEKVAIYYYNEAEDKWEYRGGDVDEANHIITLKVPHFSSYGVFVEADTTSEDPAEDEEEDELPDTFSNLYNYLLIGFLLLIAGAGMVIWNRKRNSRA